MKNKSTLIAMGIGLAAWVVAGMLGVNNQNDIAFGDTEVKGGLLQIVIAALASGSPFAWEKLGPKLASADSRVASVTQWIDSWQVLNDGLSGDNSAEKALDELWEIIGAKCRECKKTDDAKTS